MHAMVVETIPAIAFRAFAVAFEEQLAAALIERVMLAGHVMHLRGQALENLRRRIEFLRLR